MYEPLSSKCQTVLCNESWDVYTTNVKSESVCYGADTVTNGSRHEALDDE